MSPKNSFLSCVLISVVVLSGCVTPTPPLYRWGQYEDIMYSSYKNGGSDPVNDAVQLSEDMARTEAEGAQVPPGARAHLAYLYALQGNTEQAKALFEAEKAAFPESAVFIDGMIARMAGS